MMLNDGLVLGHPLVIGELACGNLNKRAEILRLLKALPEARVASHAEVLHMVDAQKLYGLGVGWIDMHLLTSTLLSQCNIWTLDKRLAGVATNMRVLI